jgi:hypothetical protein
LVHCSHALESCGIPPNVPATGPEHAQIIPTRNGSPVGAADVPVEVPVELPVEVDAVAALLDVVLAGLDAVVLLDFFELPQPATTSAAHTASTPINTAPRFPKITAPPSL